MESSQPSAGIYCDIIDELRRTLVDHVAKDILSQLDVYDLLNAELVSKGWRQVVLSSRAWSIILQRNIAESALWKRAFNGLGGDMQSMDDREKCLAILNSFKDIERNWRAGKCRTTKHVLNTFQLAPAVTMCCTSHSFQMNLRYIFPAVGPLNHWNTIAFTDRETMQISKVVHLRNVLYHCEANETLAFLGYYDGILSVFDIDSGQEVHQLSELKGSAIVGLRIHMKTLITLSFIDGPNPEDKLLSFWNVEGPFKVEMKVQVPLKVWTARLELDEKFAVVLMDAGAHVVSCRTNQLIHKIDFPMETIEAQYGSGVLLTLELVNSNQQMRFTDVSTGSCLRLLDKIEPLINSFRLNSKFVIVLGTGATVQVIDFKRALQQHATWPQLLLASVQVNRFVSLPLATLYFDVTSQLESAEISAFHADDFQVVAFGRLLVCLDFTDWVSKSVEDSESSAL